MPAVLHNPSERQIEQVRCSVSSKEKELSVPIQNTSVDEIVLSERTCLLCGKIVAPGHSWSCSGKPGSKAAEPSETRAPTQTDSQISALLEMPNESREQLRRHAKYLTRLEELRKRGEIGDVAYSELRKEYLEKLRRWLEA